MTRTLTIHVTIQVDTGDVVCLNRLNEDALPDSTTGRIKDVTRVKSLFADGDDIVAIISRVVYKHKPTKSAFFLLLST